MKFNCGKTAHEKYVENWRRKQDWHPYFCWWPRRMTNVLHDCRWLEWVERKGTVDVWYDGIDWTYEYRPHDPQHY